MYRPGLVKTGFILLFLGMLMTIIASLLIFFYAEERQGAGEGGVAGCIVIFFIPICFGVGDQQIIWIMIPAILLTILLLILFILPFLLGKLRKI